MAKTNFLLYNDMMEQFSLLSREQRGDLIMTIFSYVNGIELPEVEPIVGMAFSFIKARLDKDREAYENKCAQNTENGKKGGRPRKATVSEENQTVTEETEKTERFLEKPKKADIDTDIDTDTKKKTSPTERKKKAAPTKHKHGEYQHVLLTDDQYQKLVADYGQEDADGGIQAVDAYCEEHGKTYSNYALTVRKWGIDRFRESRDGKRASPQYHNRYNDFPQRDTDYKKLQKDWNRKEYGGYHNRYNDFPQRDNDYKKIEEDWIRNAFGQ